MFEVQCEGEWEEWSKVHVSIELVVGSLEQFFMLDLERVFWVAFAG